MSNNTTLTHPKTVGILADKNCSTFHSKTNKAYRRDQVNLKLIDEYKGWMGAGRRIFSLLCQCFSQIFLHFPTHVASLFNERVTPYMRTHKFNKKDEKTTWSRSGNSSVGELAQEVSRRSSIHTETSIRCFSIASASSIQKQVEINIDLKSISRV
ncbi:hypothetical protein YC2023_037095 [Brassica napus]